MAKNNPSKVASINLEGNLQRFINGDGKKNKGRHSEERYASFDYCFNHFQSFRQANTIKGIASQDRLQESCLQLGFYLASWGMLRGSSFLLEKSARNLVPLIEWVANCDKEYWAIDVDNYSDANIALLLKAKAEIKDVLGTHNNASDILATKIMLGVFGNIPAFDNFFMKAFGFFYFKGNQLKIISEFYRKPENKKVIDAWSDKIFTFDFFSGKETRLKYTKAKIVDMIGFIEGQRRTDLAKKKSTL